MLNQLGLGVGFCHEGRWIWVAVGRFWAGLTPGRCCSWLHFGLQGGLCGVLVSAKAGQVPIALA